MSWSWVLLAYGAGALPFSMWVGRLALRRDIRDFGDHNPGATNVFRAGGWLWGGLALALDVLKGWLPVALALWLDGAGLAGPQWVALTLAPPLGHATSPLLGFHGGKGVATTFGVWTALLGWPGLAVWPVALVVAYSVVDVDGWAVLASFLGVLAFLAATGAAAGLFLAWLGCAALLSWTHRADLAHRPNLAWRWRGRA
jgi:acyl phosphate:glycerol-3-phosphate acyltransferase